MQRLSKAGRFVFRSFRNFDDDHCFDRATVIAYFGLLSFIPLAVLLVSVGALALGSVEEAEKGTAVLLANVLHQLPPQLMQQVSLLQDTSWSHVTSLVLLLWTASKVFSKLEKGLDHVFRVGQRRPYAVRKLFAMLLVGVMSVLLVATVLLSSLLGAVDRFIDSTALAPLKGWPVYELVNGFSSRYVIPWAVAVVAFCCAYRFVPARFVPWRSAVLGGLVAGSLWEAMKWSFAYYVSNVASYTRTYGAVATIVVFLLWSNFSASLLLWGGELAALDAGFRDAPDDSD